MKDRYVIVCREKQIISLLIDGTGYTKELHIDDAEETLQIGDIYLARVTNIARNLNAAFVEITDKRICYLPLEEVTEHTVYTKKGTSDQIQQGDELLVQIKRDAIKTKAPAVTTRLTLNGQYIILEYGKSGIGISKKIPQDLREKLKEELADTLTFKDSSVIIRTNAAMAETEEILSEAARLQSQMNEICKKSMYRKAPANVMINDPVYFKRLHSLYEAEVEEIIVDHHSLYDRIIGDSSVRISCRLYQDELLSLDKMYSVSERMQEAFKEKIWLNCGGYLIIQPTEALTVIDVNSGKFTAGKEREKAFRKVNQEAAIEAMRQIRARNISGMIMIDFINMDLESNQKEIMQLLKELAVKDPVHTAVVDLTGLHLVELTRKKTERSIYEIMRS